LFVNPNGGTWSPDSQDIEEAERAMLAVAAGDVGEVWTGAWLRERIHFDDSD